MSIDAMKQALEALEKFAKGEASYIPVTVLVNNLRLAIKQEEKRNSASHDLYTDADKDRPDVICDSNGQVALSLCKRCGRGEAELYEHRCTGEQAEHQKLTSEWFGEVLYDGRNTVEAQERFKADVQQAELNEALAWAQAHPVNAPPQRQPLTQEEIGLLTTGDGWSHCDTHALALFARAIERKHGIGGEA